MTAAQYAAISDDLLTIAILLVAIYAVCVITLIITAKKS
jgi:hypothetical protein